MGKPRRKMRKRPAPSGRADERWAPPPLQDCEETVFDLTLDATNRVIVRERWWRGQLVDFAMVHQTRLTGSSSAPWVDVAKIDCCHGESHRHLYDAYEETSQRKTLRILRTRRDVDAAYDQANELIVEGWQEHLRRWGHGRT